MIKSSYLVKGQRKFIVVVKSQSKYLAGQHFDRGRRSEYRIYRSVTPCYGDVLLLLTSYARFAIDLPHALESVFYGLTQDGSEQQQNGS